MTPKHFQEPISKNDQIEDILTYLGLKSSDESSLVLVDYTILKGGLKLMTRKELAVLHHQLWELWRKRDDFLEEVTMRLTSLKERVKALREELDDIRTRYNAKVLSHLQGDQ